MARAVIAILAVCIIEFISGSSGQFGRPFRFDGFPPPEPTRSSPAAAASSSSSDDSTSAGGNSSLIWQPLRATFRPLNRQGAPAPPSPPNPPTPPSPPAPPVPLALSLGTEPISASDFSSDTSSSSGSSRFGSASDPSPDTSGGGFGGGPTVAPPAARDLVDNEDLPTRVPLSRFRPTRAPSVDAQTQPAASAQAQALPLTAASRSHSGGGGGGAANSSSHITSECLDCICEASTNCNPNSRCQTSDVRHTRCGMFLISYDQWLDSGLSKELVSAEALARDAAADERTFYECVTDKECAERLLTIYAQKNAKDCDKDGRIDCYDMAAVHQGGLDNCQSEALLDSQYWSDFNACLGFGR